MHKRARRVRTLAAERCVVGYGVAEEDVDEAPRQALRHAASNGRAYSPHTP